MSANYASHWFVSMEQSVTHIIKHIGNIQQLFKDLTAWDCQWNTFERLLYLTRHFYQ